MSALLKLSVLALCLWTASAFLGVPSGELTIGVDNGVETSVTIPSRNGCREILRCTGNGTMVEWRRIGSRRALMPVDGNKMITTMMTETDTEGHFSFTSYLVFNPIEIGDAGMWKCTIDSLSYTADFSIEADIASPMPSSHNLSTFTIGETLPVLCPVQTCLNNITVHLVHAGEIMDSQKVKVPEEETPQFNLDVNEDLAGREFFCRAVVNFMGEELLFEEAFQVTGTPLPQPVTEFPTKSSQGDGGGGGGGGGGQSAMYAHTHILALGLVILSLAIFLY